MKAFHQLITVSLVFISCLNAETYNVPGTDIVLTYTVSGNDATITGCNREATGSLIIPSTIDGYAVKTLDDWAFSGSDLLTSIHIPASVQYINNNPFRGSASLGSITVAEDSSNFQVVDGALYNFTLFKALPSTRSGSFTIQPGTLAIEEAAFYACESLTELILPSSLESIQRGAFSACTSLTEITLPANLQDLSFEVFNACSSLLNIFVEDGNTSFSSDNGVLYTYGQGKILKMPEARTGAYAILDGIRTVGSSAFAGSQLSTVLLPDTVTLIEISAFSSSLVTSIELPDSVLRIQDFAFAYCGYLVNVDLGNGLRQIDDWAFIGCNVLNNVVIPNSVTSMGQNTFDSCHSLKNITLSNQLTQIPDRAFKACMSLEYIQLPPGVISIGEDAFDFCTELKSISIPSTVNSIGQEAFSNCYSMQYFIFEGNKPTLGSDVFDASFFPEFYVYSDANGFEDTLEGKNVVVLDLNSDGDGDALTNSEERDNGTNPVLNDSDGDGLDDGAEIANGLNPLLANEETPEMRAMLESLKRNPGQLQMGTPIIWEDGNQVYIYLQLWEGDRLDTMQTLGVPTIFSAPVDDSDMTKFYRISAE